MRYLLLLLPLAGLFCQQQALTPTEQSQTVSHPTLMPLQFEPGTWQHYLQHLPFEKKPIVDYKGREITNQQKQFAVLPFDVGRLDLQQCADALMRLRAEYLWYSKRPEAIAFHFTNGLLYRFTDYCKGLRPVKSGAHISKTQAPTVVSSISLRQYLNLVYMYAGTISLARELKPTNDFGVGTIIIKPGSPGHCMIIIDEAIDANGERYYRLVEGYTPAQSIYILQNPNTTAPDPWINLKKGRIETLSYTFDRYQLGLFVD
jgi:hypothetical protein